MAATNKNYKLPYTLFSSRKHPRIIDLFRMRNIENDLNDWQKFFNEEFISEEKNADVEFTDETTKTISFNIAKQGYDIVGVTKVSTNDVDCLVHGWDANANGNMYFTVIKLNNLLAAKSLMTNATASSTSTLNTGVTPNTVSTTTTITPTRITRQGGTYNVRFTVIYRKKYTAYAEKEA